MISKAEHQPFLGHSNLEQNNLSEEDLFTKSNHNVGLLHQFSRISGAGVLLQALLVFLFTSTFWIILFLAILIKFNRPAICETQVDYGDGQNITSGMTLLTCGNSTAEAKQLGCKYDVELNNWIQPQCFDQESIDEYMNDKSWTPYRDMELKQKLVAEEMGDISVYFTSERDHINHCVMVWRRQFKVMFSKTHAIDAMSVDPMHTEHCAQFLLGMSDQLPGVWTNSTRVYPGRVGCWVREQASVGR